MGFYPTEDELKEAQKRGDKVTRAIGKKLKAKGYKLTTGACGLNRWASVHTVNGVSLFYEMGTSKSGRLALKFGLTSRHRAGKSRRFPEPNVGFNTDKLVDAIVKYVEIVLRHEKSQDDARTRLEKVRKTTRRLEKEFPEQFSNIEPSVHGIQLSFRGLNPKQAEALLKAAEAVGIGDNS